MSLQGIKIWLLSQLLLPQPYCLSYTSGMKVLIVEDDIHLAETIKSNLVSENYVVEIAEMAQMGRF